MKSFPKPWKLNYRSPKWSLETLHQNTFLKHFFFAHNLSRSESLKKIILRGQFSWQGLFYKFQKHIENPKKCLYNVLWIRWYPFCSNISFLRNAHIKLGGPTMRYLQRRTRFPKSQAFDKRSYHSNKDMRQNSKMTRQSAIFIQLEKYFFVPIWLNEMLFEIQCKIRDVLRLIHGSLRCFIILGSKANGQVD